MEKKMTKREVVLQMLANEVIVKNEVWKAYLTRELELLEKKATSKKATKTQVENETLKGKIVDVLARENKALTVTELLKADVEFAELSNQKMSALVSALCNDKVVYRFVEKKKAYFRLATEGDYAEVVTETTEEVAEDNAE